MLILGAVHVVNQPEQVVRVHHDGDFCERWVLLLNLLYSRLPAAVNQNVHRCTTGNRVKSALVLKLPGEIDDAVRLLLLGVDLELVRDAVEEELVAGDLDDLPVHRFEEAHLHRLDQALERVALLEDLRLLLAVLVEGLVVGFVYLLEDLPELDLL